MEQINGTTTTTTKSIDVGGIFLLDLSVNESDSSNQCNTDYQSTSSELEMNRTATGICGNITTNTNTKHVFDLCTEVADEATLATRNYHATADIIDGYMMKHQQASNGTYRQTEYLGSSLDRLASVINCDEQQHGDSAPPSSDQNDFDEEQTTMAIQQRNAGRRHLVTNHDNYNEVHSSYSISDGSFAASSDASLSASFTGCSEDDEGEEHRDVCDKDSTTTREDSGVLDLRDLEGQLNSCSSYEYNDHISSIQNENQFSSDHHHHSMGKPISVSTNILAKNLISSSNKNNSGDYNQNGKDYSRNPQHPHRTGKPTNGRGAAKNDHRSNQTREHHQQHLTNGTHQQNTSSRRHVSASVPIQVPIRQMRKDLNKMKLNLLREEQAMEQELAQGHQDNSIVREMAVNSTNKSQNQLAVFEDDDAFLDQEYNANHQNHYPIDEHGDEKLTASDDPMRLFASIQALARSLHEDAEIFGSLPPKRTLESPIRSMALV